MRLVPALLLVLTACGPKVAPKGSVFDEDLAQSRGPETASAEAPAAEAPRPVAPVGKGLRSGTIARDKLVAVLDAGPGTFLRQLEIAPKLSGERFVGWQLVQLLDRAGPLVDVDIVPGDVLLAINGKPLSRPDQLQTVWDSLRTANTVSAQLWRGQAQFSLEFAIEPQVTAGAPAAPAKTN
jgi:type II secretory pathway component PulC